MNREDQEFLVQKIRTQYTEKEHTQLEVYASRFQSEQPSQCSFSDAPSLTHP